MKQIFHRYERWECLAMYQPMEVDLAPDVAMQKYAEFLRDTERFEQALCRVIMEWPIACEQFLSNPSLNRVAWLGQAAMCIETGVPRKYRAGFMLLTASEQDLANAIAQRTLHEWTQKHARENQTVHSSLAAPGLF